jgi:hypothetical protein
MNHIVEEEHGTYLTQERNTHDGYYAGDFSALPFRSPDLHVLLRLSRQCG